MKRLVLIFAVLMLVSASFAQGRGSVKTLATFAVEGNNNVTSDPIQITGSYTSLFISVAITRISTAAGGVFYLKNGLTLASAFEINQSTNPGLSAQPNDTLTTADVATQYVSYEIKNPGASKYFIYADGDANDTLSVVVSYMYK